MLRSTALSGLMLLLAACSTSHQLDDGGFDSSVSRDGDVLRDSAVRDAARRDAAPSCSIVGRFDVTIEGNALVFDFRADDTWTVESDMIDMTFFARYSVDGATLRIYNPDAGGGEPPGCEPSAPGVYTLSFNADCSSVSFIVVSDTCTGRAMSLDGLTMTRVP